MTITNDNTFTNHISDGSSTEYAYDFRIDNFEDMYIYFDGVEQEEVSWSISEIGNPNGGSVTFDTAPALDIKITLQRIKPYYQLVSFDPYQAFPAKVVEQSLDNLTMQTMQLQEQLDRALLNPPGSEEQYTLPSPEADKVLVWNSTGTALINGPGEGDFQGWVDEAQQAVIDAEAQVVLATEQAGISESWANASNMYASNSAVSAGESEDWAELSEDWADSNYGVVVETGYSSKHWSIQSQYWANEDEGVPVPGGGGLYSAKHWALKANNGAIINLSSSDEEIIEVEYISNNSRRLNLSSNIANGIVKLDDTNKIPLSLLSVSNLVLRGTFDGSDICPKYGDSLVEDGTFEEDCGVNWTCSGDATIANNQAIIGRATGSSVISQGDRSFYPNATYKVSLDLKSVTGTCEILIRNGGRSVYITGVQTSYVGSGTGSVNSIQLNCGTNNFATIEDLKVSLHSLINGWTFEEACGVVWACSGSASISGGQATLPAGDSVSQVSSNILTNTDYRVIIDIASIGTTTVIVQVGDSYEEISSTGETILSINTGNTDPGKVDISAGAFGTNSVINSVRVVPVDTEDCVEPDYRNPSERFTTATFSAGEYYYITGVTASGVGGHMNLIDKADYTEKAIEVEDNDAILFLEANDQEPGSPEGWYLEPGLAVTSTTAADVAFDDSSTVVSGATVQAFNQNLDTSVDRKLNKTGGDITGNVIFDNIFAAIQFRDSSDVAGTVVYMDGANNINVGGISSSFTNVSLRLFQGNDIGFVINATQDQVVGRDLRIDNAKSLMFRDSADGADIVIVRANADDSIDIGGITNQPVSDAVKLWQGNVQAVSIEETNVKLIERDVILSHDNSYKIRNYADTADIAIVGLDDNNHAMLGTIDGGVNDYVRFYQGGGIGAELTSTTFSVSGRDIGLDNNKVVKFNDAGVLGYICEIGLDASDNFNIGSDGTQPVTSNVTISQGAGTAIDISETLIEMPDRSLVIDNDKAFVVKDATNSISIGALTVDATDKTRVGGVLGGKNVSIIQGNTDAIFIDDNEVQFKKATTHDNQAHTGVTGTEEIDFNDGNRHSVTMTGDATLTFVSTTNVGNFLILIDTVGNTCTLPTGMLWAGGELPVIDNGVWLLSLYWNGTLWFASASQFATV